MLLTDQFRSYSFRLVLLAIALFSAPGFATLAFVHWRTSTLIVQEVDDSLREEMFELAQRFDESGISALIDALSVRASGPLGDQTKYLLLDARSESLAGDIAAWPRHVGDEEGWATVAMKAGGDRRPGDKVTRVLTRFLPGGYRLAIGRDMTERAGYQGAMEESIFGGLILTLLLGVSGGILVTRRLLLRLDKVNLATKKIVVGNLDERIPVEGSGDEFDQLASNLNRMLDEIDQLVSGMREVTDNIAHDLRHPLARLRNHLEMALAYGRGNPDLDEVLHKGIDEADGILETFNALLRIAQLESGAVPDPLTAVDLSVVAANAAELYEPMCEEHGLSLTLDCEPGITVDGIQDLLSQAVVNILENAIKYTPAGGVITLAVHGDAGGPRLIVSDTGPGIPEDKRESVLSRFVRLDASRSTPGTGLGLSLVAAIAGFHGAVLELDDNHPGLVVSLSFPGRPGRWIPGKIEDARPSAA